MCITEYNEEETMEMFKEEGREEGKTERDKELIVGMLRRGKTADEIADFCNYPLSLIKAV